MLRHAPASARQWAWVSASTAVLLAGAALSATGTTAAAQGTPDTAATVCRADQPRLRHIVLFGAGTDADAARAEIGAACGAISGYYPEVAVAVATSADSSFADRIGHDRAYSAQAEALTGAEPPPRPPLIRSPLVRSPRAVGVQSVTDLVDLAAVAAAPETGTQDRTGEQWDMDLIDAGDAHRTERGNTDVLVGVLDSGVDADHPELADALDRSASAGCLTGIPDTSPRSWRPSGDHGTHVAGIIAAADDGAGVTGVAPGVRIAAVKVVDQGGFIYPESALCGFMWAARNDMRVTNNSYYVDPWLFTCSDVPGQSVVFEALRRASDYATSRGVLAVAAAGNENLDLARPTNDGRSPSNARRPTPRDVDEDCTVLPAGLPDVLTVSAVGAAGTKSSYSSYGLGVVDVTAPGGDVRQRSPSATSGCVLSTVPGGYGRLCGTSMATPHATGVAALAASAHPDASPAELATLLTSSATVVACPAAKYDPDSDGSADAQCTTADPTTDAGPDGAPVQAPTNNSFYGAGLVNAPAVLR